MKTLRKIDEAARKWEITKEKRYKDEWYELIKKFKHENASDSAINRRKFNTTRS